MKFKATTLIITVSLIVGVAFGIYLGNNGFEDLSLVGDAEAAGGTVTGPNEVAPDRFVYYPGTEVIAEGEMNPTTRSRRFKLQAHDEVHRLTRVGPAVEYVTDDDEMRCATGPANFAIDHAAPPQDANERVVSAVDIGDRDDSICAGESPFGSGPRVISAKYCSDEGTQKQQIPSDRTQRRTLGDSSDNVKLLYMLPICATSIVLLIQDRLALAFGLADFSPGSGRGCLARNVAGC